MPLQIPSRVSPVEGVWACHTALWLFSAVPLDRSGASTLPEILCTAMESGSDMSMEHRRSLCQKVR